MQKTNPRKRKMSKYAAKLKSGKMMYGPGCCGHRIRLAIESTPNARRLRREEETFKAVVTEQLKEEQGDYAQLEARILEHLDEEAHKTIGVSERLRA